MVNWVEVVGPNVVASLAKQANVDLTSGIIELLEKFGVCVEKESRTRNIRLRRYERVQTEVHETYSIVYEEVENLRNTIINGNNERYFYVYKHSETRLPIVCLKLNALPDIYINVSRHYKNATSVFPFLTFGLGIHEYCGGRLTGHVSQAHNKLVQRCIQQHWRLSVTDLINSWTQFVHDIPKSDRLTSQFAHATKLNRIANHQNNRVKGKWKPKKQIQKQQKQKQK